MFTHRHQLGQLRTAFDCLGQLRQHIGRDLLGVAVQPALGQLQLGQVDTALCLDACQFGRARGSQFIGVLGHHLVAIGDDRLQRVGVRLWPDLPQFELGRCLANFGQTDQFHRADIGPADIEFKGLDREFGRSRVSVVVVVQFFAADDKAPRRYIGRSVRRFEIAITPVMANTVDDAGGHHRNPQHLHRPDRQADRTEHSQVYGQHHANTFPAEPGVEIAFDPVVGRAATVLGNRLRDLRFDAIELNAGQQQRLDATGLRAVRVFLGLAFGMVFAVDRHKFLGHHARGQPKPEPEEMFRDRMQVERPMGLSAVEKNRDRADRDVGHTQRYQQHLPPR